MVSENVTKEDISALFAEMREEYGVELGDRGEQVFSTRLTTEFVLENGITLRGQETFQSIPRKEYATHRTLVVETDKGFDVLSVKIDAIVAAIKHFKRGKS